MYHARAGEPSNPCQYSTLSHTLSTVLLRERPLIHTHSSLPSSCPFIMSPCRSPSPYLVPYAPCSGGYPRCHVNSRRTFLFLTPCPLSLTPCSGGYPRRHVNSRGAGGALPLRPHRTRHSGDTPLTPPSSSLPPLLPPSLPSRFYNLSLPTCHIPSTHTNTPLHY